MYNCSIIDLIFLYLCTIVLVALMKNHVETWNKVQYTENIKRKESQLRL